MNTTMEAGDCLYTPALLLHYVRSWDRNVAAMTMFQREERYDKNCNGAPGGVPPPEPQPLSAYDVMWSFPEEDKSLLGWNVVKMGFPNWKRQYLFNLAGLAKDGRIERKRFFGFVKKAMQRDWMMKGVKDRVKKIFNSMDLDRDGFVETEALFTSRELRFLLKDISVGQEGGRGDQEEDVEVDRFDLQGNVQKRKAEL